MDRRKFIKGLMLGAGAATGLSGCSKSSTGIAQPHGYTFNAGQPMPWTNWASNQACQPSARLAPQNEDELISALLSNHERLRPVGAGHSFSGLVPTNANLVSTDLMSGLINVDTKHNTAEVWSGTRLHQLGPALARQGKALSNLPDINYQTIAGATATSTHGSGVSLGSLSSMIEGLTLATPNGELLSCNGSNHPELFDAARCGLGALGVITRLKLRTVPAFKLRQRSGFENVQEVLDNIEHEKSTNRHFEFLAFPHTSLAMVVRTNRHDESDSIMTSAPDDPLAIYEIRTVYQQLGTLPVIGDLAYEQALSAAVADSNTVRSGDSYEVLTHDRVVRFREMEYTVPADAGPACLKEILSTITKKKIPVVFPIEYRYVQRDDVWLSMFSQRDGCSISIHQFFDEDYRAYFDEIEPIFWKYEGRPHWGKLHTLGHKQLSSLYPHWQDFLEIRHEVDPNGRLLNDHLEGLFGLSGTRS